MHSHGHIHNDTRATKNISIVFFLNITFTIIEIIGGILTNSVAIVSDALHDIGDSLALGSAWFLERFSNKKKTNRFSYGFRRLSLLSALLNSTILLIGSVFVLRESIPRFFEPQVVHAKGMVLLSIVGIIVNGLGVYKTVKGSTMNEKVISLHLLEDVLGWIATFIVSILVLFTDFYILDPILSIIFTCYIISAIFKQLKITVLLFLQASPEKINNKIIKETLSTLQEVQGVHDTHIWSLDGEKHVVSTHVVVAKNSDKFAIINLKQMIREQLIKLGITYVTIEIEFEDEQCDMQFE